MSGIMSALVGSGGGGVVVVNGVDSFTVIGATTYSYGYNNSASGSLPSPFGSIRNGIFNSATIIGVYSKSPPNTSGSANAYYILFNGNRSAGFFNTLKVNNTLVSGTLNAPNYNSAANETTFSISLASPATTLFGTTAGVNIPVILT